MKLSTVALFGVGYVLGTRAGRERYDQLVALGSRLADRLDEQLGTQGSDSGGDDVGARLNGLDPGRVRTRS